MILIEAVDIITIDDVDDDYSDSEDEDEDEEEEENVPGPVVQHNPNVTDLTHLG